jgi:hypothetical protein
MQGTVRMRILLFLVGVVIVPIGTVLIILFAKGYRPSMTTRRFMPTGLLVADSFPDGAQIYLNGKLTSATNTTVNLTPGEYDAEIKKEGYFTWKKHLNVQAEIVTRATAYLFPTVPSLKAVTSTGAANPSASPELTHVAFANTEGITSKLYVLDLSESPLGLLNREARLITSSTFINFSATQLVWAPDSRQILAVSTSSAYLIDLGSQQLTDVTATLTPLINSWKQSINIRNAQKFGTLPEKVQTIFATSAADLVWSPKENKVLYTATASAVIPDHVIRELPGSSTQPQARQLAPGTVYVYDLEEDRNFAVGHISAAPTPTPAKTKASKNPAIAALPKINLSDLGYIHPSGLMWFPTSLHLFRVEGNKINITEYDGQNSTTVYAGPLLNPIVIPYPSAKQMLILTNLTPTVTPLANLYAISLR